MPRQQPKKTLTKDEIFEKNAKKLEDDMDKQLTLLMKTAALLQFNKERLESDDGFWIEARENINRLESEKAAIRSKLKKLINGSVKVLTDQIIRMKYPLTTKKELTKSIGDGALLNSFINEENTFYFDIFKQKPMYQTVFKFLSSLQRTRHRMDLEANDMDTNSIDEVEVEVIDEEVSAVVKELMEEVLKVVVAKEEEVADLQHELQTMMGTLGCLTSEVSKTREVKVAPTTTKTIPLTKSMEASLKISKEVLDMLTSMLSKIEGFPDADKQELLAKIGHIRTESRRALERLKHSLLNRKSNLTGSLLMFFNGINAPKETIENAVSDGRVLQLMKNVLDHSNPNYKDITSLLIFEFISKKMGLSIVSQCMDTFAHLEISQKRMEELQSIISFYDKVKEDCQRVKKARLDKCEESDGGPKKRKATGVAAAEKTSGEPTQKRQMLVTAPSCPSANNNI